MKIHLGIGDFSVVINLLIEQQSKFGIFSEGWMEKCWLSFLSCQCFQEALHRIPRIHSVEFFHSMHGQRGSVPLVVSFVGDGCLIADFSASSWKSRRIFLIPFDSLKGLCSPPATITWSS